jgi:hypothetical protein
MPGQIWEWHSTEEQKSHRSQETNSRKRMIPPRLPRVPKQGNAGTNKRLSMQSIGRTTRTTTMDFWRNILAVVQVAAAASAINFEEVKSAPMARFHRVGEVFPDALYGHIIVTFDVAELNETNEESPEGDIVQAG